jgi:hypothetical protein
VHAQVTSSAAVRLLANALGMDGDDDDRDCEGGGGGSGGGGGGSSTSSTGGGSSTIASTSGSARSSPTNEVLAAAGMRAVSVLDASLPNGGYDTAALVRVIHNVGESEDVLITHDLDTIHTTARALASALAAEQQQQHQQQPRGMRCAVVMTGSRLPERFRGSDAALNVGMALGALRSPNRLDPGVYVAYDAQVVRVE